MHNFEEKESKKPVLAYRRKIIIKNRSKIRKRVIKDQNKAVIRKLKDVLKKFVTSEEARKYSIKIGEKMWKMHGK